MKVIKNIGLLISSFLLTQTLLLASNLKNIQYSDSSMQKHWKGYAIIGNGKVCAVYSDDKRIEGKGIHHLYYNDYTCNYINSTSFNLYQDQVKLNPLDEKTGNISFFATSTKSTYGNSVFSETNCFAYPQGAIILSLKANVGLNGVSQKCEINLADQIITDKITKLESVQVKDKIAVAQWSNKIVMVVGCTNPEQLVEVNGATLTISGKVKNGEKVEIIIIPSKSIAEGINNFNRIIKDYDLYGTTEKYWNSWMDKGKVPEFSENNKIYIEYFKRNLYCVKSALLNGQIPADITGQFVTNNMPQLYPRDEMMCARVFLLTGHPEEAKEIIEFWNNTNIAHKSNGEWYARYDANVKAIDAGSGARYDEPEWDANGYYIQLNDMYYKQFNSWLSNKQFIYELADFLVNKIDKNNLLYEGGIVEWTGYLPATNMTCAAALLTASDIAKIYGDNENVVKYKNASDKISSSLYKMFDKTKNAYTDMRFTGKKGLNNESLSEETKDTVYLWDTSANFGIIWGYPNHPEAIATNDYYVKNTFKLGGGVQYFDSYDKGILDYGHASFFFTTPASAQYQALYGNPQVAKTNIDWMIRNANIYGLMPERIYPDNSDCSPATPLSWCCAEFSAAIIYYSRAINKN